MTLDELKSFVAAGFTAADLRALGAIPNPQPQPDPQPEPQPQPDPQPEPQPQPDPQPEPQPDTMPGKVPDGLQALAAQVQALVAAVQAGNRAETNVGGRAKIIDPMEAGAQQLGKLSGID